MEKHPVEELAEMLGGEITAVGSLPDGSGFATMTLPLPENHWLYDERHDAPPMPFRMGLNDPRRQTLNEMVRGAAQWAIRASTMNGKEMDFDPDAMVKNLVVAMLGYHTQDGLSGESWSDPDPVPPLFAELLR